MSRVGDSEPAAREAVGGGNGRAPAWKDMTGDPDSD